MAELLSLGAVELARRVRRRELSAVEIVDAHLARIAQVDPKIRAVVAPRFDEARREAREAERAIVRDPGRCGPLHGVPFTVKEILAVEGMPLTAGSVLRRGVRAPRTATAVQRVRDAGAILLGLTNLPEMGFWMETDNRVYGRTRNPWDLDRTPGGSSGGEAAIIAAGGSVFGVGSDAAGSIRMPALFCGVFGHKPTAGWIPLTGHFPFVRDRALAHLGAAFGSITIGPMTRTARDLAPLVRIMAGADGIDPGASGGDPGEPAAVDLRGRRVLVLEDPRIRFAWRVSPEMREATRRAAGMLAQCGADVRPWSHDAMRLALEIWIERFARGFGPTLAEVMGGGRPPAVLRELLRLPLGRSRHTAAALLFCLGERVAARWHPSDGRYEREAGRLLRDLESSLDGGVLLMPTHPRTAPVHGRALLRPVDWAYTAVWNALRVPATQVPLGRGASGLPVGVQVVGARGNDAACLAAALALESASGGWSGPAGGDS